MPNVPPNDRVPAEEDPDDHLMESAFAEIDALAEDVRTKQSVYGPCSTSSYPADAGSSSAHHLAAGLDDAHILDEDMKKKLAVRTSAAISLPGAFDSDGRLLPKPSQEILLQRARDRKEEKKRRQNMENDGPKIGPDNEEEPLDGLQLRMNEFIDFTNKEDEEAQKERKKQQRRRRVRIISLCVVGLIVVIAVIVGGVVVGTGGGDHGGTASRSSPTPVPTNGFDLSECIFGTTDQSARYYEVRAAIVSEHPAMEMSIDTIQNSAPRKSLCWLVYVDALKVDVTRGDVYQVIQRFVLALIYFHFDSAAATGEPNRLERSNWLAPVHECEWDFVVCDADARNEVERLEVEGKLLSGTIPSELSLLTQLVHIGMEANFLRGRIPLELWTMTKLEWLNLNHNLFTGTFPKELTNLTGLKQFHFGGASSLSGTIPDLSALTNMEDFILSVASELSPFPDMSGWTNLGELTLGPLLKITGTLPAYIGSLSKLKKIHIGGTRLTGTLPSELGNLVNLGRIDLAVGDFSGSIPSELGNLTGLSILNLQESPFISGAIPSELGRLSNLELFDVSSCWSLTGAMPAELCALRRAQSLKMLAVECEVVVCDCCDLCARGTP